MPHASTAAAATGSAPRTLGSSPAATVCGRWAAVGIRRPNRPSPTIRFASSRVGRSPLAARRCRARANVLRPIGKASSHEHRRASSVRVVVRRRGPRRGLRRRHAADHHRRRGGDRVSGRRADGRRRLQPQRRRVRVRRRPAGAVPDLRELRGRALVDRCRNVRPAPARGVPRFAVVGRGADARRLGRDRRAAPRTRSVPSLTPRHCLGSRGRVRSSSGSRSMPRSASAFASADRISNAAWA